MVVGKRSYADRLRRHPQIWCATTFFCCPLSGSTSWAVLGSAGASWRKSRNQVQDTKMQGPDSCAVNEIVLGQPCPLAPGDAPFNLTARCHWPSSLTMMHCICSVSPHSGSSCARLGRPVPHRRPPSCGRGGMELRDRRIRCATGLLQQGLTCHSSMRPLAAGCLEHLCESKITPGFPWMPDGKVSVVPDLQNPGHWLMFWPGGVSYRSLSETAFPEDHHGLELNPQGCAWELLMHQLRTRRLICSAACMPAV